MAKKQAQESPPVLEFECEDWDIERLRPTLAAYNPRTITDRMLDSLKAGITEFGMIIPVVVNKRTGRMVGGHQRFRAADALGLKTIPVHQVDLDEAAEKRLNLALNKVEGKWDYSLLETALETVSAADTLEQSGFNEDDLVAIMSESPDFDDDFDNFVEKFTQRKGQDFLVFRSPDISFSCPKAAYDKLVQQLYRKVGVSDSAASQEFFSVLGLA